MFKHHFTLYFGLKTLICLIGYIASVAIGQESSVLITVAGLSALAIPLIAYLESQQ